jgi:outer membrane protein TolC
MLALVALLQVAAADSLPRVTLTEALERSARLDPGYVRALGNVNNAEWGRWAALTAFIVPTVSLATDYTRASAPSLGVPITNTATASMTARLDVFTGGQKIAGLGAARAQLESARAGELQSRFVTALLTEADYYAALSDEELARVAAERVRRAEEQLATARARVLSGAATQTDSLVLQLEVNRARVAGLRQNAELNTSRRQLGRRVGLNGPARAAPLDSLPARELPFALDDAVRRALSQGPAYRIARANARAADAQLWSRRGSYLPRLTLTYSRAAFDSTYFPEAFKRNAFTVGLSFPIWDGAQREIAVSVARANRDVARAFRDDLERAASRDVGVAYDAYQLGRAEAGLAVSSLAAARENFRVQETRYRSGATTILDLVDAQLLLAEAEANMVLARYSTRLAQAALEAVLGQRLFDAQGAP